MLKEDINEKRKSRHKQTQEDFTPESIVKLLCEGSEELFTNFNKTFLDPCMGSGNIIIYILRKRFENCKTQKECQSAIETAYGTELMDDNTEQAKNRIMNLIEEFGFKVTPTIKFIINHNIVCTDTFKWNYELWQPIKENRCESLF